MADNRRNGDRTVAMSVHDAGIGACGKQALHFAHVAARHGAVQERVAEWTLVVRIADVRSHAAHFG